MRIRMTAALALSSRTWRLLVVECWSVSGMTWKTEPFVTSRP